FAMLPWAPRGYFQIPVVGAAVFTGIGILYALAVPLLWYTRRIAAATMLMGFGMTLAIAILFGLYFPSATFLRLPEIVGTKLRELEPDDDVEVMMIGFTEPSLIFYKGGRIRPL